MDDNGGDDSRCLWTQCPQPTLVMVILCAYFGQGSAPSIMLCTMAHRPQRTVPMYQFLFLRCSPSFIFSPPSLLPLVDTTRAGQHHPKTFGRFGVLMEYGPTSCHGQQGHAKIRHQRGTGGILSVSTTYRPLDGYGLDLDPT